MWNSIATTTAQQSQARLFDYNRRRFPTLTTERILVVIDPEGVHFHQTDTIPAGSISAADRFYILYAAAFKPAALCEFFSHEDAAEICRMFAESFPAQQAAAASRRWRWVERETGARLLVKDFVHHYPLYPHKGQLVAVAIALNGLALFSRSTVENFPPLPCDQFALIRSVHVNPDDLVDLFSFSDAVEISAAFRMNRREFLNVLAGGRLSVGSGLKPR